MPLSRREASLAPFLAAFAAQAAPAPTALPSKTYRFEDLAVKTNGQNRSRAVFDAATHTGVPLELHITELGPGQEPHPPHHHVHEEMIMIQEGTLEVTIAGKSVNIGPGSTAFVASGEEHGWRNVGTGRALYFVLALGQKVAARA